MIGAMFNGLSGLDAFQKALNTQSNNIANVNTVGYKSDSVTFADLMYQDGVGKGAGIMSVQKNYDQGELKVTGNSYDVALQGDGFFVVDNQVDDKYKFTRAGNLRMGEDGTLQTPDFRHLVGNVSNVTSLVNTDANHQNFKSVYEIYLGSQVINTDTYTRTINAKTTDYQASAKTDDIIESGSGYKTAGIKVSDIEKLSSAYREALEVYAKDPDAASVASAQAQNVYTFDMAQLNDESDIVQIFLDNDYIKQQFDTDAATTMKKFADEISKIPGMTASVDTTTTPGNAVLTITGMIPGEYHLINSATLNDVDVSPDTQQAASMGTGLAALTSVRDELKKAIENADAKFLEITNEVGYLAQGAALPANLNNIQLKLNDLNLAENPFGDIEYDAQGNVYIDQEGSKFVVGKLSIVRFVDNLELEPEGNNVFDFTEKSGEPFIAYTSTTKVIPKTLEMSNSNLAVGLTDLMVFQRAYEANAKSLTTSDEFLNIAIQLKK